MFSARHITAVILPLCACSAGLGAAEVNRPPTADRNPNIVLILADNVGYGELGVYGGGILRGAPTPRIDRLASEGMRLLNFNVEAQCTPSRSALMTGPLLRFGQGHTRSQRWWPGRD
jgi:hypothetical protein